MLFRSWDNALSTTENSDAENTAERLRAVPPVFASDTRLFSVWAAMPLTSLLEPDVLPLVVEPVRAPETEVVEVEVGVPLVEVSELLVVDPLVWLFETLAVVPLVEPVAVLVSLPERASAEDPAVCPRVRSNVWLILPTPT